MKLATVTVVVLVASFTLTAAQSANIDPTPAPYKIDMMQRPTPVYVLNFPEVQTVEGTVAVSNLPAVQTVGGTVAVSNLPLDADGAVRVAGGCPTAPPLQARYVNLLPGGPLTMGAREVVFTAVVDARGFSRIGVVATGILVAVNTEWTWANLDPLFSSVADPRNGNLQDSCNAFGLNGNTPTVKQVCVASGEQVRLRLECWDATCPVTVAGVYLIP